MADDALNLLCAHIAYVIAKDRNDGTIVAATMIAAHIVGIKVLATGIIGGIYRIWRRAPTSRII